MTDMTDATRDAGADATIRECLSLDQPRSFFLFAGAGSGKTRSLKEALEGLGTQILTTLRKHSRKIAVITYTNAAADEITRRVKADPVFQVQTIHSFAWSLIEGRSADIRGWLESNLQTEIAEIQAAHAKGRSGTDAHDKREKKMASKTKRLERLAEIRAFTYAPEGDNFGRDALQHTEVIALAAHFLTESETFQNIVLARYPFILIDESQDTMKPLMEALLTFEARHRGRIVLGLLGDTMQRIYTDGLRDLDQRVGDFAQPAKQMNHRSRKRIVDLANSIRRDEDGRQQRAREDKPGGTVRVFLAPSEGTDRATFEVSTCVEMARVTGDPAWQNAEAIKTLTIERHMAAARLGFSELFEPLSKPDKLKDGFRDGTLPAMRLFTHRVLPLVTAQRNGDAFAAMAVLRDGSPLVDKRGIRTGRGGQATGLDAARAGVAALMTLFNDEWDPSCAEVLAVVAEHRLFPIPDQLRPCLPDDSPMAQDMADILAELDLTTPEATPPPETAITGAWTQALKAPFSQVARYLAYVEDRSPYGTHQGVKGLEFPRVMVIADDAHTRFKGLASYETLFDVKRLSPASQKKAEQGEETTIERTRRLLYVTCTRAEESLALVLYSEAPDAVRRFLITNKWMAEDEVVMAAADGTFQEAAQQC
ncbi:MULTISPECIES: UvrD-helicase domain-containing protein [unclassified Sulfitobacter]|jgi:DNA helicase-2/ATP-dependent DNA helicase PcrA|uniref:UvrD-helicase domain-containing protein n=1 Tax=unclassified Sulfitobacter TaxID=196795 RepID=UPI0007C37DF8|nr:MULTISPECIES: UvrD-helicase domain-containing protein [unclassified Sulfitobacter]KZX98224.1 Fis family transcriptional regulator [Sulfitobacter sp. HI0021]KZY03954.1 Fis family transcriptional regulator [Sulfitobacter sp. HI0027]KZZ01336.1 Fis family transcriptional regulator [Sulfitobacter sp. HI0076]